VFVSHGLVHDQMLEVFAAVLAQFAT